MESGAGWHASNGEVATVDLPVEVEVSSVDVSDMEDLALLLEKDADWTHDGGYVDPCHVEACRRYRNKLSAI